MKSSPNGDFLDTCNPGPYSLHRLKHFWDTHRNIHRRCSLLQRWWKKVRQVLDTISYYLLNVKEKLFSDFFLPAKNYLLRVGQINNLFDKCTVPCTDCTSVQSLHLRQYQPKWCSVTAWLLLRQHEKPFN